MTEESPFRFVGYRISKIHCEIEDGFDPKNLKLSQSVEVQQNYDEDKKRFVEVIMDVSLEAESFKFFIRMKGGFLGTEDMSQELFEKLATQNSPAIMYPFARSIITSYTAQANIPPIILPAINFAAKFKQNNKRSVETTDCPASVESK
ncbi:protein-export chaperone SecB [Desulfonema magnum]|uniref:Preprotein translocase domain-containing protein n=1 Tax=Desulfonema magnum TaxID=45655 RepID=A0A975BFJ8_9BACT|nr:protein-export chaperone SecB [Desulfonema magnum]QTA84497.1 Preprotein translocase domain-containing protein [Desulfonema magnum]